MREYKEVSKIIKAYVSAVYGQDKRNAKDKNEVFVGRIRKDLFNDRALNMWIVADNLRKGAATNAVQIAEHISVNYF